jgi:hypothetical protein
VVAMSVIDGRLLIRAAAHEEHTGSTSGVGLERGRVGSARVNGCVWGGCQWRSQSKIKGGVDQLCYPLFALFLVIFASWVHKFGL